MKIGIVFKPYVTIEEPFRGGMSNFVFLLANNLTKLGHKVTVLGGKNSKLPEKINHFKPAYAEDEMNIYQAGDKFYKQVEKSCKNKTEVVNKSFGELSGRFDKKIQSYLEFFAYANSENFDLIHIVTHDVLALYPALFSKTPCVVSFHGHYDVLGPDFLIWLKNIKKLKKTNCHFVSVSKYIQKEYSKFLKSELIYNGIEINNYQPKYKKQNYLAFLGRIDYHKGLEFAIDFSRKYKIPLVIGGRIEDQPYFNKLKIKIDGKLIKFIGRQNEKQKNQLLGNAKATIMSSHYNEAFGRVTAESLACATPVIAFDKGATPELVINKKTGFLIKENSFEQAKKAWDNLDQINLKSCRDFVEKNFDIQKQILKYERLYQKIIKK